MADGRHLQPPEPFESRDFGFRVGVAALGGPEFLVEIEAIAVVAG